MHKKGIYEKYFKRLFDLIFSSIGLVVFLPFLLVIFFIVRITLGSPAIFRQNRPGLNEKIFVLYKFRTMRNTKDINGNLLPDKERLSKFGNFLRTTSIDELPSLINIIKGDLSIIGPRPLAVQYLPFYTDDERIRHEVRPGLTGYAQINGRNALSWETKFKFDIHYVNNISLLFDIKIFISTIAIVFRRKNIGIRGVNSPIDFDIERSVGKKEGNNVSSE